MINIEVEEKRVLSSQDITDIITFSLQEANKDGYLKGFIFERALVVFSTIMFYQETKEELAALVTININEAFDKVVKDGYYDKLYNEHAEEFDYIINCGIEWYNDLKDYQLSARGIFDMLQTVSGDIVNMATERLQEVASSENIKQLENITERWTNPNN
jgi:hypothetical protein